MKVARAHIVSSKLYFLATTKHWLALLFITFMSQVSMVIEFGCLTLMD